MVKIMDHIDSPLIASFLEDPDEENAEISYKTADTFDPQEIPQVGIDSMATLLIGKMFEGQEDE